MSTWYGFVLILGNHINNIDNFFEAFGYRKCIPPVADKVSDNYHNYETNNQESFAICEVKGWTIIYDVPLNIVDIYNSETRQRNLKKASSNTHSIIFTMQTQDQCPVAQYFIADNGQLVHGVTSEQGTITYETGIPLTVEIELNYRDLYSDEDVFKIMKAVTGIGSDDIFGVKEFIIKTYNNEDAFWTCF